MGALTHTTRSQRVGAAWIARRSHGLGNLSHLHANAARARLVLCENVMHPSPRGLEEGNHFPSRFRNWSFLCIKGLWFVIGMHALVFFFVLFFKVFFIF